MRLYTILISLILLPIFSIAQQYEIEYSEKINVNLAITSVNKLILKGDSSVYYKLERDIDESSVENEVKRLGEDLDYFVLMDYAAKKVVCTQFILNKIFYVQEDLPIQAWEIQDETKQIQSFSCQKAVANFRGRTYAAWFTRDIPTIGGPWKFGGLPGLILEVTADDGTYEILATSLKKVEDSKAPAFAYNPKDAITWEGYCKEFQKYIKRVKKRMAADTDPEVEYELKVHTLEIIDF